MRILAIETSCDETALAVLNVSGKKYKIEAHQVASQIALHTQYGGVFPMMAKREHSRNIVPLFLETLKESGLYKNKKVTLTENQEKKIRTILVREEEMIEPFLTALSTVQKPKIDRIAVTVGPGLEPALWVGINFAKALSFVWDIPLVPVNHMEGHILSIFPPEKEAKEEEFTISDLPFPVISLLVSGGHTELILMKAIGKYTLIGQTRDDAAGEAFDKVARILGLPYPGGPHISRLAKQAREWKVESGKLKVEEQKQIVLPRPMLNSNDFDFSFSGLKTAVLYLLRDLGGIEKISEETKMEIAREFEDAAVEVLVKKTIAAAKKYKSQSIIVGGGVSANNELKARLMEKGQAEGITVSFPSKNLHTDNAIMIAIAGYFGKSAPLGSKKFIAQGNLEL